MSNLLEALKDWYKDESYPADGPELGEGVKQVSYEIVDDSPRWGSVIQVVYTDGENFVAVQDVEPATEMQDWGDYGDPEIFEVRPVEVTVTKYEKV